MQLIWAPLSALVQAVPLFHVPRWSIFGGDPAALYAFPPFALALLFIGNFLGEELYYRGYLMKKSGFLGRANWVFNPFLFALYNLWQIPFTWPLIGLVLAFGLLMWLRKRSLRSYRFSLFREHVAHIWRVPAGKAPTHGALSVFRIGNAKSHRRKFAARDAL